MIGVYKITNKINNKCYIGISFNIEQRWKSHIKYAFSNKNNEPYYNNKLYNALRKYGVDNFNFEIIEECEKDKLKEREIYWISYYNSYKNGYNLTIGGDIGGYDLKGIKHPNSKLTENDIIDIRNRYNNLERKMDVYLLYEDKINSTGFDKVWKGSTWTHILMDVYTPENKKFHARNTSMIGSKNGRSKLNENDVYNIRLRRKNKEKMKDVYNDYSSLVSISYFRHVWYYETWKNIIVE